MKSKQVEAWRDSIQNGKAKNLAHVVLWAMQFEGRGNHNGIMDYLWDKFQGCITKKVRA